eukprot:355086-Chlamydomonas_euryale.AAC.5
MRRVNVVEPLGLPGPSAWPGEKCPTHRLHRQPQHVQNAGKLGVQNAGRLGVRNAGILGVGSDRDRPMVYILSRCLLYRLS